MIMTIFAGIAEFERDLAGGGKQGFEGAASGQRRRLSGWFAAGRMAYHCVGGQHLSFALTETVPPYSFFDRLSPIYTRPRFLPASKVNAATFRRAVVGDGCIISDAQR
jgi:hypothetical protein